VTPVAGQLRMAAESERRSGTAEIRDPEEETKQGCFMAMVIFDYFFLGLFLLHALPWMVLYAILCRCWRLLSCGALGDPMESPDYLDDGRVNVTRWLWSLYLNYGSTATAVVATTFGQSFKVPSTASFGIGVGYVTWFASIAALATLNFLGEWRAGTHAREKYEERSWLGSWLVTEFFWLPAEVKGGQAFVDVLIAASMLPAVVVGFLAFWFARPRYSLRCSPKIDNSDLCNEVNGRYVCCRVVNSKFDLEMFIPYTVVYVITGYVSASILIRLLVARHSADSSSIQLLSYRPTRSTTRFQLMSPHVSASAARWPPTLAAATPPNRRTTSLRDDDAAAAAAAVVPASAKPADDLEASLPP